MANRPAAARRVPAAVLHADGCERIGRGRGEHAGRCGRRRRRREGRERCSGSEGKDRVSDGRLLVHRVRKGAAARLPIRSRVARTCAHLGTSESYGVLAAPSRTLAVPVYSADGWFDARRRREQNCRHCATDRRRSGPTIAAQNFALGNRWRDARPSSQPALARPSPSRLGSVSDVRTLFRLDTPMRYRCGSSRDPTRRHRHGTLKRRNKPVLFPSRPRHSRRPHICSAGGPGTKSRPSRWLRRTWQLRWPRCLRLAWRRAWVRLRPWPRPLRGQCLPRWARLLRWVRLLRTRSSCLLRCTACGRIDRWTCSWCPRGKRIPLSSLWLRLRASLWILMTDRRPHKASGTSMLSADRPSLAGTTRWRQRDGIDGAAGRVEYSSGRCCGTRPPSIGAFA